MTADFDELISTAQSLRLNFESVNVLYDVLLRFFSIERPSIPIGPRRGKLITLDGHSGSGKDTQIECLRRWLTKHSQPPHRGTKKIATVTLKRSDPFRSAVKSLWQVSPTYDPKTSFLLLSAGRRYVAEALVAPLLADPQTLVIQNRSFVSHVAYHAGAAYSVEELLAVCKHELKPDHIFVLNCETELALQRIQNRAFELGRPIFINETSKFIDRVKIQFGEIAKSIEGIFEIDTSADVEMVAQRIRDHVDEWLKKR